MARINIPAAVKREILVESGHRCAVCGTPCPMELAHIVPWQQVSNLSAESLICLCASCHARADSEDWGSKTLREYKKRPWILRQSSKQDLEAAVRSSDFELQVVHLLRLMGYEVAQNVHLQDRQVDILATSSATLLEVKIAVECVSHDKPLGVERIREFSAFAHHCEDIDAGMIICRSGFTAAAKTFAASAGRKIQLVTFDELLSRLIDFRPYLHYSIDAVSASDLFDSYVELRTEDSQGNVSDAQDAIGAWFGNDSSTFLLLLGEVGSGKTTLCKILCANMAKRRLESGDGFIPILLPLRHFHRGLSIEEFITQHFARVFATSFPIPAFASMLRAQLFTLIFDGLDECENADAFIFEFERFRSHAASNVRCIVSSRPHAARPLPRANVLTLLPFSREQVHAYLLNRQGVNGDQVLRWIHATYNLSELASRPILLHMIADTATFLVTNEVLNAADLYDAYTRIWFERENQRGDQRLSPTTLQRLVERLAFHMQSSFFDTISGKQLDAFLHDALDITAVRDLDAVRSALRSCGFIFLRDSGDVGFGHKSFQEYFAARYINSLSEEMKTPNPNLPSGVDRFLRELQSSTTDKPHTESLDRRHDLVVFAEESEDRRQQEMREEIAHQIGTPLGVVANGFSELLTGLSDAIKDEQSAAITSVRTGIERMRRLIRRIGMLSTTRRAQKSKFDIATAIQEAAHETAKALHWNGTLSINADIDNTIIDADEDQMRQMVQNVVENSIHAMDDRGTLHIAITDRESNVQIDVSDNGCGIDSAIHDDVFKPYFSTRKARGGIGLGLSIVKNIVANHGGTLRLESLPGKGTTMRIVLPKGAEVNGTV